MDLRKWGFTFAAIAMTAATTNAGLLHDAPLTNTVPTPPPPAAAVKPAPVAAVKPAPAAAVKPEPAAAVKPAPVAAVKPEPAAAAKTAPAAAVKPEPAAAVKPAPAAAVKPEPAAAAKTAPAAAAKPEPAVVATPAPAVVPVVVDEAAAVAAPDNPEAAACPPVTTAQETPCRRAIGAFAAVGKSDGTVLLAVIGADYQFDKAWHLGDSGRITPIGELEVSYWEGEEGHTGVSSLHEAGAVFIARYRYLRTPLSSIRPFLDIGAGIHYVTETEIEGKELGRNWLASSNIGAGFLFGRDERFEVGARIRHLSNAGTDELNWGVNQLLARIGYRF